VRTQRRLGTSFVAGLLLGLCACDSGPEANGPLGRSDGPPGSECLPQWTAAPVTYSKTYANGATQPATVTAISLRNPRHLQLVSSLSVPAYGFDNFIGEGRPWPLPQDLPGVVWAKRRVVAGTVLPPNSTAGGSAPPHGAYIFAVAVRADPETVGTADGADVSYEVGDVKYVVHGQIALKIATKGCRT
jgi:hypothetical protein